MVFFFAMSGDGAFRILESEKHVRFPVSPKVSFLQKEDTHRLIKKYIETFQGQPRLLQIIRRVSFAKP